jgi:pimeloyl-ACP methyl ester carboxylesterase
MRKKILALAFMSLAIFYSNAYCRKGNLEYSYKSTPLARTFKDFYERHRNFSRAIGVPDQSTERLVIHDEANAGIAILYIHGFGASRGEGEMVVDKLASDLKANVYYARLPGHALDGAAQAAVTFDKYLHEMEEAFLHMHLLGKKIVVMGTSTGALIATYIAAKYPERIYALVLASPFWDFGDKTSRILNFPGGFKLASLVMGSDRDANWKTDPEKRKHPDYEKHWLVKQKFAALIGLNNLRRFVVTQKHIGQISMPVLTLVYYKDDQHKDTTIDLKKVRALFPHLGLSSARGVNPHNKLVEVADGNHVLLSEYVRTDKPFILAEIKAWLKAISAEK